jgi:uncharacterized membrane protein
MSLTIAFSAPRIVRAALALALSLGAASCASTQANHIRPALTAQESCCKGLADPNARNACLTDVPRTQDEASAINQETFQCVERHFRCDPVTGRATRESAQLQLDCINDLESTQQARGETPAPH